MMLTHEPGNTVFAASLANTTQAGVYARTAIKCSDWLWKIGLMLLHELLILLGAQALGFVLVCA